MQTRIMNLRDAGIKLSCAFCLRIQLTYLEVEFSVAPSAAPCNCLTNVISIFHPNDDPAEKASAAIET